MEKWIELHSSKGLGNVNRQTMKFNPGLRRKERSACEAHLSRNGESNDGWSLKAILFPKILDGEITFSLRTSSQPFFHLSLTISFFLRFLLLTISLLQVRTIFGQIIAVLWYPFALLDMMTRMLLRMWLETFYNWLVLFVVVYSHTNTFFYFIRC